MAAEINEDKAFSACVLLLLFFLIFILHLCVCVCMWCLYMLVSMCAYLLWWNSCQD